MTATDTPDTRMPPIWPIGRDTHRAGANELGEAVHTVTTDNTDQITLSFFEDQVPAYLEAELERLYQSIYSSMARLQIYDQCKDLCAYAAYRGTEAISVILFRRENKNVIVLNQQTHLDALEISRFAAAIFSRYKSVAVISFWGLMPIQGRVPFPSHQNYCLPEVVVMLPESPEAYLSSFGKHLRYDIRRNLKKLKQTFPSFRIW